MSPLSTASHIAFEFSHIAFEFSHVAFEFSHVGLYSLQADGQAEKFVGQQRPQQQRLGVGVGLQLGDDASDQGLGVKRSGCHGLLLLSWWYPHPTRRFRA